MLHTLVAGLAVMALTHAVVNNVLALFITPIAESLGVARSEVALMNTFISLASVIGAPVWGWLYGRTQTKKPLLFGILILIAVLAGLSAASELAQFYVLAFMMGFVFAGVAVMPVTLLILESAPERSRALMLSIALAGSGLGGVILNPVVNSAIQNQGYQRAFLLIGLLELVLLVPLVIMLPAKTRKAPVTDHDAATAERNQLKTKLFKGPFLLLFFGTALTAFTSLAALLNFPSYLLLCGYGAGTVSLMTALGSGALMAGKILLGLLYDRLGLRKATLIVCIAVILGFLWLWGLGRNGDTFLPGVQFLSRKPLSGTWGPANCPGYRRCFGHSSAGQVAGAFSAPPIGLERTDRSCPADELFTARLGSEVPARRAGEPFRLRCALLYHRAGEGFYLKNADHRMLSIEPIHKQAAKFFSETWSG